MIRTPESDFFPRLDWAVIMARGNSSRMGLPKGSVVLELGQPPMLTLVVGLYRQMGWPRAIVTLPELKAQYRAQLAPDSETVWIVDGPGGDTARTLQVAWAALAVLPQPPTHLWAHPVDLPLVNSRTLAIIKEQSRLQPRKIVRPIHDRQPGHPVVLPADILTGLFSDPASFDRTLPMRALLAPVMDQVVEWPVSDPGVVRDFDDPDALPSP